MSGYTEIALLQYELAKLYTRVVELEERRCEVCGYAEHHREHTGCLRKQVSSLKAELREICAAIDDPACDLTLTTVECIKKLKAENESLKWDQWQPIEQLDKRIEQLEDEVAIEKASRKYWEGAYSEWVNTDKAARGLIAKDELIASLKADNESLKRDSTRLDALQKILIKHELDRCKHGYSFFPKMAFIHEPPIVCSFFADFRDLIDAAMAQGEKGC